MDRYKQIMQNPDPPPLQGLVFPVPSCYLAGGIHRHVDLWAKVTAQHHKSDLIPKWLKTGMDINDFSTRFQGSFGNSTYDAVFPPRTILRNLQSCRKFTSFISSSLLERIRSGSIKVWGKVGDTELPYLVLPLTVEPSKPCA